jgi:hypothetical protein
MARLLRHLLREIDADFTAVVRIEGREMLYQQPRRRDCLNGLGPPRFADVRWCYRLAFRLEFLVES